MPLSNAELETKLRALWRKCLCCPKPISDEEITKKITRCKKCQRAYESIWYRDYAEFLKQFDGQL